MSLSNPPPTVTELTERDPSAGGDESRLAREQIAELTRRLRSEHDEYERAAQGWTPEAGERKREARKAREGTLREIQNLAGAIGEGERFAQIERLPFAQKVAKLEAMFVPGAAQKAEEVGREAAANETVERAAERRSSRSMRAADVTPAREPASATGTTSAPRLEAASVPKLGAAAAATPEGSAAVPAPASAAGARPVPGSSARPPIAVLTPTPAFTLPRALAPRRSPVLRIAAALAASILVLSAWRIAHRTTPAATPSSTTDRMPALPVTEQASPVAPPAPSTATSPASLQPGPQALPPAAPQEQAQAELTPLTAPSKRAVTPAPHVPPSKAARPPARAGSRSQETGANPY